MPSAMQYVPVNLVSTIYGWLVAWASNASLFFRLMLVAPSTVSPVKGVDMPAEAWPLYNNDDDDVVGVAAVPLLGVYCPLNNIGGAIIG